MVTRLTALRTNEKEMTIRAEIEALRSMTVGRLRERYAEVFGEPSRSYNKQFLFRRVAWRIAFLDPLISQMLAQSPSVETGKHR